VTRLIDWRNAVYAVDGRVLSWRAKAVAGAVSIHADGNGRKIRPSVDRLAAESGLASRTVDTALRELREAGFLIVEKQGGGRNRPTTYRAAIPSLTTHDMHRFFSTNGAHGAEYLGVNDARRARNDARGAEEDVQEDVFSMKRGKRAKRAPSKQEVDLSVYD
jgi:DNA-binding transcriptional ArsR family regulator